MGEFIWEKLNWLQALQLDCKKGVGGNGNTGRGFYGLDGPKRFFKCYATPITGSPTLRNSE